MARFSSGWIKIWRKTIDSDLPGNVYLWSLWHWLLIAAHWKPSKILWNGKQREIPAGAVVFGLKELAIKWDCSRSVLSKWLQYLHDTGRIVYETSPRGCIVIICNWELYQSADDFDASEREHGVNVALTPREHGETLIEEVKKRRKEEGKSAVALPLLAQLWNEHRRGLPEVKGCSGTRRRFAETRWREKPDAVYWTEIIERITRSPFCTGDNDRGWRADFDFLIRPETHHKVLEGKYDTRSPGASPESRLSPQEQQDLKLFEQELAKAKRDIHGEGLDA